MSSHVDATPVVEAGPFEFAIVDREPERFDEVQRTAGRGAQSGDVARVRRNLRFHEHDAQRRIGCGHRADSVGGLNGGLSHSRLVRASRNR